ncbi:MAG TPA: hypothetical protein VKB96_11210 [Gammaproteobacteria bacterium]|jgi:hypothetical protein|nr:hypothetical protein [Gammaproteobacteria bacterium]
MASQPKGKLKQGDPKQRVPIGASRQAPAIALAQPVLWPITSTHLTQYDVACRAIAEANAIDEVRAIDNKAHALRAYARQSQNRQLEIDCAEIRLRAKRKVGELSAAIQTAPGLRRDLVTS